MAFTGTVSNVTGARVPGARITVLDGPDSGLSVDANANGDFRFGSLTISNVNFSATSGGYREVRAGTYVDGINTLNFVFTLASLTGTVSNTDGVRLSGAIVTVLDGSSAGQSVGTDASGGYRFEALDVANANLVAMKDNHDEDRRGTFVNGTNTLNFTLVAHPIEEAPPEPETLTIFAKVISGREWEFVARPPGQFSTKDYDWTFGDGNSEENQPATVRHTYSNSGTYTVKVRAVYPNGSNNTTTTIDITVN